MFVTLPDLLRLLAVPLFAWAGYHDVRTRRVPNWLWPPLVLVGLIALVVEWSSVSPRSGRSVLLLRCAVSLGLIGPVGHVLWRLNTIGGADAKAIWTLAVVFPAYPTVYSGWGVFPLERTVLGVFSLTILSNAVLIGLVIPLALAGYNAVNGRITPAMFVGRPRPTAAVTAVHGRLLFGSLGFTGGLDLDALRIYLRWRDTSLEALCSSPDTHRDPAALPTTSAEDPWGGAAFLSAIEGDAYGTTPQQLRRGLERLCRRDSVWISPGIPFLAVVFLGLLSALAYGDLLFTVIELIGMV